VASIQFALHYMFESEGRARRFLSAVARHLRPGGCFIATTVDARVMLEMLAAYGQEDPETGACVATLEDEEQRELCRLQVDAQTYGLLFRQDPAAPVPDFGLEYRFLLKEGGDDVS
jgi:mRNA (guanine-N7-)-methyltransferase